MQHNDASLPMIKCDEVGRCMHPFSRGWYHYDCVKFDAIEAQSMVENNIPWICRYCINVKKKPKCTSIQSILIEKEFSIILNKKQINCIFKIDLEMLTKANQTFH